MCVANKKQQQQQRFIRNGGAANEFYPFNRNEIVVNEFSTSDRVPPIADGCEHACFGRVGCGVLCCAKRCCEKWKTTTMVFSYIYIRSFSRVSHEFLYNDIIKYI